MDMRNLQGVRPSQLLAGNPASNITITKYVVYTYTYTFRSTFNPPLPSQVHVPEVPVRPGDLHLLAALQGGGAQDAGGVH